MQSMNEGMKKYRELQSYEKRIKGGVVGICPLCETEKQLRLSHIVPKWAYYWMKQEDRGRIVGNYESLGVNVIEQDGSKNYMLCDSCEQFFGDAENYVKVLMHGNEADKIAKGITRIGDNHVVDFDKIQRFALGLVFKAHYGKSAPFHNISLIEEQISSVRLRILNPKNEDLEFPIIVMRFKSEVYPDISPVGMMIPQQQKHNDGTEFISFLMAGWEWVVFLNGNNSLKEKFILDMRLSSSGLLQTPEGDITDQRFINRGKFLNRRERRALQRKNKKIRK